MIKKLLHKTMLFVLLIMVIFTAPPAEGQVLFEKPIPVSTPFHLEAVTVADIDADGIDDLIVASTSHNQILWYKRDHLGNLAMMEPITNRPFNLLKFREFITEDFDLDGDIDVMINFESELPKRWFRNSGKGIFSEIQIPTDSTLYQGTNTEVVDFDGDGYLDLVIGASATWPSKIQWLKNNGTSFEAAQFILQIDEDIETINVADVDGDGYLDLVTTSPRDKNISWYRNNRANIYQNKSTIDQEIRPNGIPKLVDLDNDNDLEVVAVVDGTLVWYSNLGSEGFYKQEIEASSNYSIHLKIIDYDGDGDWDIFHKNRYKLSWLINDGSLRFKNRHRGIGHSWGEVDVAVIDLDNDGQLDIIPVNNVSETPEWYRNMGDERAFWYETRPLKSSPTLYAQTSEFADLDNDGDNDILVASTGSDEIVWFEYIGGDQIGLKQIISSNVDGARDVTSADLDNDGDLDVLSASLIDNRISWYQNDGNANFSKEIVISTTAHYAQDVHTADIDHDGDIDVLSASEKDDKIAWYRNNGDAIFSDEIIISINADGAESVQTADLDGDGNLDVFSVSENDGKVAWYKNDGLGNFSDENIITLNKLDYPQEALAGDMDGDGDWDIVVASQRDGLITWYRNDGLGNFGDSLHITNSTIDASAISLSDLDNDGDIDVLAAWRDGTQIILNNGEGQFSVQPFNGNLGLQGTVSVKTGDVDQDGDDDILLTSSRQQTVKLVKNWMTIEQPYTPAEIGNSLPMAFSLTYNYPNPFSQTTQIHYSIDSPHHVNVSVFDMMGRQIDELMNQHQDAGKYDINFDATNISSGVYFYRLQIGQKSIFRKMIVLK